MDVFNRLIRPNYGFCCFRCRELLKFATQGHLSVGLSKSFKTSSSRKTLLDSACRLCEFIGSLRVDDSYTARVKLLSIYSLNPNYADYDASKSRALLAVQTMYQPSVYVGEGTFGLLHPISANDEIKPRRIEPKSIDFRIIQNWLHFCEESHQNTCRPTLGELVPGFKVIDCRNRQVVQPEQRPRYVALSYVWGALRLPEHAQETFPRTIEDSILTTVELGFQYLWVDKYVLSRTLIYVEMYMLTQPVHRPNRRRREARPNPKHG